MKQLFAILAFLIIAVSSRGSHIVGGDFSLTHIEGNDYYLTLKVFRDCENGIPPFNDPLYVGMYEKSTHRRVHAITMSLLRNDTLIFVGNNCINIPTGCTHIGLYRVRLRLDPSTFNSNNGYYFSWERCCRNTIIKNVVVGKFPGETGAAIYMEIPPLNRINSTPVFNKNPLTLLCTFNPFSFNYNVTDADGDSLVYSLITPIKGKTNKDNPNDPGSGNYPVMNPGPYPTVDWQNGYGINRNIMDGAPDLTINRFTGQLSVTPTQQGVYIIAIKVEEYRDGIKLGEVIREMQFTISSCMSNPAPVISDAFRDKLYVLNATDTLCLPFVATDARDSLHMTFEGDIFTSDKIVEPYATFNAVSGKQRVESKFCWTTTCAHISEKDTHEVIIRVTDNGCPIPKTTIGRIRIVVKSPPPVAPPDVLCMDKLDPNTLRINYDKINTDKYFAYYLLIRINPDSSRTVMDTLYRNTIKGAFVDSSAILHAVNHYKYYIIGRDICENFGLPSYKVHSDPAVPDEPKARPIKRATVVENSAILVEWEKADEEDFLSYAIYRRKNSPGEQFKLYYTEYDRNKNWFRDSAVNVQQQSYCYQVGVHDKCGYTSKESNIGCNIVLKGKSIPFEHYLNWSPYEEWQAGVRDYDVYRRDPDHGWEKIGQTSANNRSLKDDYLNYQYGLYWYKVVANEEVGGKNAVSESNELFLLQEPIVYVPNAFTPNGDILNEVWGILPVFVRDFHIQVYNRWGERVYESRDKNHQWNGVYRGFNPFDNTFIYQLTYTGWDNSIHHKTGYVTILK